MNAGSVGAIGMDFGSIVAGLPLAGCVVAGVVGVAGGAAIGGSAKTSVHARRNGIIAREDIEGHQVFADAARVDDDFAFDAADFFFVGCFLVATRAFDFAAGAAVAAVRNRASAASGSSSQLCGYARSSRSSAACVG